MIDPSRAASATYCALRAQARVGLLLAAASLSACQQEPSDPSRSRPAAGSTQPAAANTAGRPNIVVLMTDDQDQLSLRFMLQTLDLIGSAGVTFQNSVATFALCCPSRATFLTGQYSHNHGVRGNGPPLGGGHAALDHTNTLPLWLQDAGYVTAHIGKYLNGYGQEDPLELVPGWTEWYISTDNTDSRYFTYKLNENGTVVSYGATTAEYKTDVFTDKAVDFIHRRAPGDAPFFLFVSYFPPHSGGPRSPGDPTLVATPNVAPRHRGRFANEVLPAFPSFNEADVRDKPAHIRSRPLLTSTKVAELHVAHRKRLESLLAVDEGVARIIDALQTEGVLDNTLVIFTSDNGWFQGQHRILAHKRFPYEASVKVPLLIRGPGVVRGAVISAPVANIDLAPTIVGMAGATARRIMDGRSLSPFLTGARTGWSTGLGPRHVLVDGGPNDRLAKMFWSIKRGVYVYTEYDNGDRELYNLRNDPDQLTSRHNAPALAPVRSALATRLAAMKTCVGPIACW
jgi:N-acetylglucosamine-6-sulfatase